MATRNRKNPVEQIRAGRFTYTIIITPNDPSGYLITCPALPGLVTEGNTLAEARLMAADAIEGYLESLAMDGLPIPTDETRIEEISV